MSPPPKLKQFLKSFDISNPDFSNPPENFPDCDLGGLSSQEVGQFNSIKTLWELSRPPKPKARSRAWKSSSGYIYLVAWSNASLLRVLGRRFTATLPRGEYRLKAQLDDNLRSVVANIEEGFAQATTSRYLDFLGYSQGSLKEGKGDFQRSCQDDFLKSVPDSGLADLGIDLREWYEVLKKTVISRKHSEDTKGDYRNLKENRGKSRTASGFSSKVSQYPLKSSKGDYRNLQDLKGKSSVSASSRVPQDPLKPFKFNYPPIDNLNPDDLTLEIFMELVNKTDWHLRRLVESLEKKLSDEQKYYQVEQARIKSKLKIRH
jgi:four helix bundle protein